MGNPRSQLLWQSRKALPRSCVWLRAHTHCIATGSLANHVTHQQKSPPAGGFFRLLQEQRGTCSTLILGFQPGFPCIFLDVTSFTRSEKSFSVGYSMAVSDMWPRWQHVFYKWDAWETFKEIFGQIPRRQINWGYQAYYSRIWRFPLGERTWTRVSLTQLRHTGTPISSSGENTERPVLISSDWDQVRISSQWGTASVHNRSLDFEVKLPYSKYIP